MSMWRDDDDFEKWDVDRYEIYEPAATPQELAESFLVDTLNTLQVDPHSSELIVTLRCPSEDGEFEWQESFESVAQLREFLSNFPLGALQGLGPNRRRVIDGVEEYAVGEALVDSVLVEAGFASLGRIAPRNPESTPERLFKLPDLTKSKLIIPAVGNEIVLVNQELRAYLAKHPEALYQLSSRAFEELVADIFKDFGYETLLTPRSRDGGRDIRAIRKDKIGTLLFLIECKRYAPDNPVGVDIVRSLYGVAVAERANLGIIATTSYFTSPARSFARKVRYQLSLRDFDNLKQWLAHQRDGKS